MDPKWWLRLPLTSDVEVPCSMKLRPLQLRSDPPNETVRARGPVASAAAADARLFPLRRALARAAIAV